MAEWLKKISRGLIKSKKQTNKFLLAFSVMVLSIDSFLFAKAFNFNPFVNVVKTYNSIADEDKILHVHPHLSPSPDSTIVRITSEGFIPQIVNIKQGDSVTWISEDDSRDHWPASDLHPKHQGYPADYSMPGAYFDSEACIGPLQPKPGAFDPCAPIAFEGMWTYTFKYKGTWAYHDHIEPLFTGQVVVK